ncbi:MAG: branched-chain amino acid ABC transporter permease [Actinomycetia bacterium]|nr:branched-chain amino acid ABC transporter permease [Actinomycetes bacterium]
MLGLQLLLYGIALGSLYALVAIGFALIFSTTRVFHIAHGATYVLAGYVFFAASIAGRWPVWVGVLVAALAALAFGMGTEWFIYRPIRRARESFFTLFVASFGWLVVVSNAIALVFGSQYVTGQSAWVTGVPIGRLELRPIDGLTVLVAGVLFGAMQWLMHRTRLGIMFRALADDPELLRAAGFEGSRYYLWAMAIGSLLAVPAAVIGTYTVGLTPTLGTTIATVAFAASIVGGIGSYVGAAVGALVLGAAEDLGVWKLPADWQTAIAFGVLFVFLLLRPHGILGRPSR